MTENRGISHLTNKQLAEEIAKTEAKIESGEAGPFAGSVLDVLKAEQEDREGGE
ncbi:hypothetical protein [Amycolatopsis sp. NPDC058986]|uniref:hypothetical protein n=1 Tax=unclassified Amycolatopsis TaxID=2618356 RepID=UPI003670153D